MPRNNRNWSAEEEKRLLDLIEIGAPRAVIAKTLQRRLSLSQTLSGWRVAANRTMLLRDEGSLQAHWLDGRRPDPVAGSA
jgi:hypothetical protein